VNDGDSYSRFPKDNCDHSREVYEEVIMPGFRRMNPAPKIALTRFGAGVRSFWKARRISPSASRRAFGDQIVENSCHLWLSRIAPHYGRRHLSSNSLHLA